MVKAHNKNMYCNAALVRGSIVMCNRERAWRWRVQKHIDNVIEVCAGQMHFALPTVGVRNNKEKSKSIMTAEEKNCNFMKTTIMAMERIYRFFFISRFLHLPVVEVRRCHCPRMRKKEI